MNTTALYTESLKKMERNILRFCNAAVTTAIREVRLLQILHLYIGN